MVWLPQMRAATTARPPKNEKYAVLVYHIEIREVQAQDRGDDAGDHNLLVRDASFDYFNFYGHFNTSDHHDQDRHETAERRCDRRCDDRPGPPLELGVVRTLDGFRNVVRRKALRSRGTYR